MTQFTNMVQQAEKIEIDNVTSCYFETDRAYLDEYIASKYNGSTEIKVIPIKFFRNFINQMASLYKNPFNRDITGDVDSINIESLNHQLLWSERYLHMHKQSLLYIEGPTSFQSINASNYVKNTDGSYTFKSGDMLVKINKEGIYDVTDPGKETIIKVLNGVIPIVEYGYPGIDYPQFNDVVELQYNCIADVSWAVHNAGIKLLSQPIVTSDGDKNEVRSNLRGLGKTSKTIHMKQSDQIRLMETGNLNNMMDVYKLYDIIVQQQAIRLGVDKYSVSIISAQVSGESIKNQLLYINQARHDFIPLMIEKEKEIFNILNVLFGTNITFNSIEYPDLLFKSETPV